MNWPLMKNSITFQDKLQLCKFILSSDRFTQGTQVLSFEKEWNNWLGSKYSVFVNSGSSANLLLLDAITEYFNIPKGSKILVPATTWTTTVSPIIQLGFTPIFCDVDISNFGFDMGDLSYIAAKHPDIKVVFTAHLLGLCAPIDAYKKLFPKAIFIEDVCESHGITFKNSKVGSNSIGSTFSFYFGHHMTCIEGGMVSTNNQDLYDILRMKRSHGLSRESFNHEAHKKQIKNIDPQFLFMTLGYNFRNTDLHAFLGKLQLKKLDSFVEKRKENYKNFLSVLDTDKFLLPDPQPSNNSSFCLPFICKTIEIKNKLKDKFLEEGVETRPIIAGNLLSHPAYASYYGHKPNANFLQNNGIYIGNNQFLTTKDFFTLKLILKDI